MATLHGRIHGRRVTLGPVPTGVGPTVWAGALTGRDQLVLGRPGADGLGEVLTELERIARHGRLRAVA